MRDPAGQNLVLSHGAYRAEVVTVGAGLRSLSYGGRPMLAGWPQGEVCQDYRGWVLMPWPNRVGDGAYEFAGAHHQLALNEPARRNALHGLSGWAEWSVVHHDDARASLRLPLVATTGYPFVLDLAVDYELGDDGLRVTLAATNAGGVAAPYGTGHHPYFTFGDGPADELTLTLPATTWCPMDERGLAGPAQPVDGTAWDFREGRVIGDAVIDHPFGGLAGDTATITAPDGTATTLTLHEGFDWLHVFTSDTHDPPRRSLAVEPTTCPPDAFRSGVDLVVLEPGGTHRAAFTIAGSAPA